jgi:DNA-3-methyladenine glycosylase II
MANLSKALFVLKKDPVMRGLIVKYDTPVFRSETDLFIDLIEAIINQQLSEKAAATIFKRFKSLFKKKVKPSPKLILALSDNKIRACGVSYAKVSYIKGLSRAVEDNKLILSKLPGLSNEEVIKRLTEIKGIGRWTAEMILIFSLLREDVFSFGDLGLRTAVSRLYKVGRDDFKEIEKISKKWQPYRSIACRYLWKSLG